MRTPIPCECLPRGIQDSDHDTSAERGGQGGQLECRCQTTAEQHQVRSLHVLQRWWEPPVLLGGRQLNVNRTPKFLRVSYDRTLRFSEHIREVRQQMFCRLNLIRRLGGTKWGWRSTQLRPVYLALIRSVVEYAYSRVRIFKITLTS